MRERMILSIGEGHAMARCTKLIRQSHLLLRMKR